MTILAVTADHLTQGLDFIAEFTPLVNGLNDKLVRLDGLNGAVVLSTCNRVEIYLETGSNDDMESVLPVLAHWYGDLWGKLTIIPENEVTEHIFRVAAGLESQVVGEREIAGQLRRALSRARTLRTASFTLAQTIEAALRASKRVERETGLAGRGRSIVSVGLDLVEQSCSIRSAAGVMIIGTGNYAGAVAAQLRERGAREIYVYSRSGRAQAFAKMHHLIPCDDDFGCELSKCDIVVACSGYGHPIIPKELVQEALSQRFDAMVLTMLDLAVTHDIEREVKTLPEAVIYDLEDIYEAIPEVDRTQVSHAEAIIAQEMTKFAQEMQVREVSSNIAELYDWANAHVEAELKNIDSYRDIDLQQVRRSMQRLANALVHLPTMMVRKAAEEGRASDLLRDIDKIISHYLAHHHPTRKGGAGAGKRCTASTNDGADATDAANAVAGAQSGDGDGAGAASSANDAA